MHEEKENAIESIMETNNKSDFIIFMVFLQLLFNLIIA